MKKKRPPSGCCARVVVENERDQGASSSTCVHKEDYGWDRNQASSINMCAQRGLWMGQESSVEHQVRKITESIKVHESRFMNRQPLAGFVVALERT